VCCSSLLHSHRLPGQSFSLFEFCSPVPRTTSLSLTLLPLSSLPPFFFQAFDLKNWPHQVKNHESILICGGGTLIGEEEEFLIFYLLLPSTLLPTNDELILRLRLPPSLPRRVVRLSSPGLSAIQLAHRMGYKVFVTTSQDQFQ